MDTSVFGGYFDDEFKQSTIPVFDALAAGQAIALISETLVGEIADAPEHVQQLLAQTLVGRCEQLALTETVEELCNAYLAAHVVSP